MNIVVDMDETLIATRAAHLNNTNLPIVRLGMCLGILENAVYVLTQKNFYYFVEPNLIKLFVVVFQQLHEFVFA